MGNYLPLLFILACPLMMIFMMRGMHGGHDMGARDQEPRHDEESNRDHRDAVRAAAHCRSGASGCSASCSTGQHRGHEEPTMSTATAIVEGFGTTCERAADPGQEAEIVSRLRKAHG